MKARNLYREILKHLKEEEFYSYFSSFVSYHRIQSTPKMQESMKFIKSILDSYDVENKLVEYSIKPYERVYGFPYFRGWKPISLKGLLSFGKEKIDFDFDLNPFAFIQRSGNLEGKYDVVLEDTQDVEDKFVLVSDFKRGLTEYLYNKNAKGILVYDPFAYEKARKKFQFWYYSLKERELFGVVLTKEEAEKLKKYLKRRKKAYIEVNAKVSFEDNITSYLLATIEGESKDAILYVAHTCHARGEANDNASGAISLLYSLITMKKMQNKGILKKPPYTVYFLFVPEMWGSALFIEKEGEVLKDIFAGFNFDMVGSNLQKTGGRIFIEKPHGNIKTNIHTLFKRIVENVQEYLDFPYAVYVRPYEGGSDHLLFQDIDMKIPMPMLIHWPCKYYHTDYDVISNIEPKAIWRNVILMVSVPYILKREQIFVKGKQIVTTLGEIYKRVKKGVFIPTMDEDVNERVKWYEILLNKNGYVNFMQFLYYVDGKKSDRDILRLIQNESGKKTDKEVYREYVLYLLKKGVIKKI